MGLFKADLYRNFAIGFALGVLLVGIQVGPELFGDPIPQAHAAPAQAR